MDSHPIRLVVTDDLRRSRLTVFFRLLLAIRHSEHLLQHALQLPALKPHRRCFDGDRARSEGLSLEAIPFKLSCQLGKGDHLRREQIDQHRHQQPLPLHTLHLPFAENPLKQHALMGNMLIDNP